MAEVFGIDDFEWERVIVEELHGWLILYSRMFYMRIGHCTATLRCN